MVNEPQFAYVMETKDLQPNGLHYDSSELNHSVYVKTSTSPCNNKMDLKIENMDSPHPCIITSPHSRVVTSPLSDPFISSTSSDEKELNLFSSAHNVSSFSSIVMSHPTISTIDSSSMEQLLTCSVSPHQIPRISSPQDSLLSSPVNGTDTVLSSPDRNVMESANTEYTLIDRAGKFNIQDGDGALESVRFDNDHDHGFDQLLDYVVTDTDSNKVPKVRRDSDAPSSINKEDVTVDKLFEADLAHSSAEFSFSKFGSEVSQGIFTFGRSPDVTKSTTTSIIIPSAGTPFEPVKPQPTTVTRSQRGGRNLKESTLCQQFPCRTDKYQLEILEQPEEQHRARYLTEGSRGAIKNVSQEGNPVVKLFGEVDHAVLQVFIGNDQGRVKPHAFYQACKVSGKNSTPCTEVEIDGTVVIQMEMDTVNDKTCSIDNVGILKLRNADVENRVGIQKAKKKSTKSRMIFRVQFQKPDGSMQTLQIASRSINCTQPIGQPEICKMSLKEAPVSGSTELIMIGKNFMKGTKVFFQETNGEEGPVIWEKEADIDKDYFQPTHLVCTIPPYLDVHIPSKVKAQVVVRCSGKHSEPQNFTYIPVFQVNPSKETTISKQDVPMETDEQPPKSGPLNITVAPEALRLNQELQKSLQTSHGKFLLPDGAVSGITNMQVDPQEKQEKPMSINDMLTQQTDHFSPQTPNFRQPTDHFDTKTPNFSQPTDHFDTKTPTFSQPVDHFSPQTPAFSQSHAMVSPGFTPSNPHSPVVTPASQNYDVIQPDVQTPVYNSPAQILSPAVQSPEYNQTQALSPAVQSPGYNQTQGFDNQQAFQAMDNIQQNMGNMNGQQVLDTFSNHQSPQPMQNVPTSPNMGSNPTGSPVIQGFSQNNQSQNTNVMTSQNFNQQQHVNLSQALSGQTSFPQFMNVTSSLQSEQIKSPEFLPNTFNNIQSQANNTQNIIGAVSSYMQQINATPLMTTSSAGSNLQQQQQQQQQQKGYSDVAMRLLHQLLVKSSSNDVPLANTLQNTARSNAVNTTPSVVQPQMSYQPTQPQTNVPVLTNHQMSQPKIPLTGQGILHQMLSQGLAETNDKPVTPPTNGTPQVQQLDSVRLQAMAQQVQQQAQQAQTGQTNGNNGKVGPQIIVLGGSGDGTGNQSINGTSASPSILILPGANGNNNNGVNPQSQVESILRSILGSLKPEPQ